MSDKGKNENPFKVLRVLIEPCLGSGEKITLLVAAYDGDALHIERAWDWGEKSSLERYYLAYEKKVRDHVAEHQDLEGFTGLFVGSLCPVIWTKAESPRVAVECLKKLVFMNHPDMRR